MPGAPNRPPEVDAPTAAPDPNQRRVVRRLGAGRVALALDLWKSAPSPELVQPLERAEASFAAGNLVEASGHLDQLSVRFAEPRWPTMPVPFRNLRVQIPPPTPPHWNPEHALAPPEKEARVARREAELHRDLAKATLDWAATHQIALGEEAPHLASATALLESEGVTDAYWAEIDHIWRAVRAQVPMPKPTGRVAPPAGDRA